MHIVTQNVSGATITDWLRTLCDIRFTHEASRKALKELLRIIDETRSERNALVHGIWHPGPIPQTALVNSLRLDRRELMKDELVTIADLDELIHRIDTIVAELTTVGKNLGILE